MVEMINSNFKLFCPGCVCEIKGNQADCNEKNKKMNLEKKECIELAKDLWIVNRYQETTRP